MRGHRTRPGRLSRARRAMAVASAGLIAVGLFVVGPRSASAAGTLTVQASPGSGTVGADIPNFGATATLTGAIAPTGSVSFTLYSDSSCQTAATPAVNGVVALDPSSGSASYSQDWTPASARHLLLAGVLLRTSS